MYSAHIEHVMRHLSRIEREVQAKIENAPPGSRKYGDGLTFLAALYDLRKQTRAFRIIAGDLSIYGDQ